MYVYSFRYVYTSKFENHYLGSVTSCYCINPGESHASKSRENRWNYVPKTSIDGLVGHQKFQKA